MATTILVTGATGTIGSQVVSALKGRNDVTVRAAVRSAAKAEALKGGNVTPVDFEYTKPELIQKAVAGVEKLFLVTPFTPDQVDLGARLVDFAKAAGVKHIVKLSAMGADFEPGIQLGRWHRTLERYIAGSGLTYTFLRPNNFMENFINFYPPGKDGNIYLPWGQGACSFIAGSDIAAVAVAALTSNAHENKAYNLTGPEAFTIGQAAATISEVSGKKASYVDVPEAAAQKAMLDLGMPAGVVDAMMELHAIDKAGYAGEVTDAVKKITGRAPMTFASFARQHAASWK
ncbi:SDR family oxidoreductase [Archangium lansingense]|uniref:SDR family oxidoreductase n=1 Tax=Archangium lansingense TaxID=2995310 RepID=UPI003B7F3D74